MELTIPVPAIYTDHLAARGLNEEQQKKFFMNVIDNLASQIFNPEKASISFVEFMGVVDAMSDEELQSETT